MVFNDLYKIGLESGKTLSKQDIEIFVEMVNQMYSDCRIYFKDALLKQAGIERSNLPSSVLIKILIFFKQINITMKAEELINNNALQDIEVVGNQGSI